MKVNLKIAGLLEINFQTDKFTIMIKTKIFQNILLMVLFTLFCVIGYAQADDCINKMEIRILQVAREKSNDDFVKRTTEAQILLKKLATCPCFEKKTHSLEKEKKRLEEMFNENFSGYVTNFKMNEGNYTGNLKNGKREGKGKFILIGGTMYEGEFKNDKYYGLCKIEYEKKDDKEYYIGETRNGFFNGWGKVKYRKTGTVYEGEFYEGDYDGWGTVRWEDGISFFGRWQKGKREGIGAFYILNNKDTILFCSKAKTFMGFYKNDNKNGNGRCYDKDFRTIYNGNFKDGKPTYYPNRNPIDKEKNLIKETYKDYKHTYEGQKVNQVREGYGIYKFNDPDSTMYAGEWIKNKYEGIGRLSFGKNNFTGEFINNLFDGLGLLTNKNGDEYTGEFKNGKKNGFGFFRIGVPAIYSISGLKNAKYYYGNWKDDQLDGFGRVYDKEKRLLYEGEFKEGKPFGDKFPNR
jgi:hypothetical protein